MFSNGLYRRVPTTPNKKQSPSKIEEAPEVEKVAPASEEPKEVLMESAPEMTPVEESTPVVEEVVETPKKKRSTRKKNTEETVEE